MKYLILLVLVSSCAKAVDKKSIIVKQENEVALYFPETGKYDLLYGSTKDDLIKALTQKIIECGNQNQELIKMVQEYQKPTTTPKPTK